MHKNQKKIKSALTFVGIVVLYCAVIMLLGIGCPIRFLTGIPCLGCGMTRACMELLHFNFSGAAGYHPLVFLLPVFGLFLWYREKLEKQENWIWGIICSLFLAVYLIRLVVMDDPVVYIQLEDGLIYKIIHILWKGGK